MLVASRFLIPAAVVRDEFGPGRFRSAGSIWAVLTSFAWLLPTHAAPWPTAYAELLMAGRLVPVAAWVLLKTRSPWHVDLFAAGFAVVALVPLLQSAGPLYLFKAEAPLASIYLIGIAFAIALGRRAEDAAPGRLVDALFASLLIAALVSTGLALAQWLSIDTLGFALAPMPFHDRPVANVGQPNNLATLLVWGLVAVWRAHHTRQVGGHGTVLAAAFLLVGITLTQSRAGLLQTVLLAVVALLCRRRLGTSGQAPVWWGLGAWLVACTLMLDPVTRAWTEQSIRPLLDSGSPRERTILLQVDLAAIAQHPWIGIGWNQNVLAHVGMSDRFPMHGTVGNAHNLVLDLFIWNGLPLGLLMTCGLAFWCLRTARRLNGADDLLLAAALGTFGIHTMLELPHVLAYFLVPAALIAGTLNGRVRAPAVATLPSAAAGTMVVAGAVLLATLFTEYRRIETEEMESAIHAAWPGLPATPQSPEAHLLAGLQTGLRDLRTSPQPVMSDESLSRFRRAVTRYPTVGGLFRYAEAAAMNGRLADARWGLRNLCNLHPAARCVAAASDWSTLALGGDPGIKSVVPPMPGTSTP